MKRSQQPRFASHSSRDRIQYRWRFTIVGTATLSNNRLNKTSKYFNDAETELSDCEEDGIPPTDSMDSSPTMFEAMLASATDLKSEDFATQAFAEAISTKNQAATAIAVLVTTLISLAVNSFRPLPDRELLMPIGNTSRDGEKKNPPVRADIGRAIKLASINHMKNKRMKEVDFKGFMTSRLSDYAVILIVLGLLGASIVAYFRALKHEKVIKNACMAFFSQRKAASNPVQDEAVAKTAADVQKNHQLLQETRENLSDLASHVKNIQKGVNDYKPIDIKELSSDVKNVRDEVVGIKALVKAQNDTKTQHVNPKEITAPSNPLQTNANGYTPFTIPSLGSNSKLPSPSKKPKSLNSDSQAIRRRRSHSPRRSKKKAADRNRRRHSK